MSEKPFRILLDLTDLHIESFNYVWISVSPRESKTIADLKQSLLKRINLGTKNIRLFVNIGVLLDEETISVLREDDTVKVQYEEQFHSCQNLSNSSLLKNRSSRKRDFSENNQEVCIDQQSHNKSSNAICAIQSETSLESMKKSRKKHKKSHNTYHNEEFAVGTVENPVSLKEYQTKREKSCISTENYSKDLIGHENENEISFVSQEIYCNTKKSNKNDERKINEKEREIAIENFEDTLMNDKTFNKTKGDSDLCKPLNSIECNRELKNNCPKKKRKRRKKSKKPELHSPDMSYINNDTSVNNEFKSFSNETSSGSLKRRHIIFTSCSPEPMKKSLENSLQFHNYNDVQTAYTHKDTPKPTLNNNPEHLPKISTPTQSDGCMDPNWHVSLMQNENVDAAGNEIESSKKLNTKNSKSRKVVNEQNAKENSCDLSKANVLPLNSRPEIGAHILYKILELNENYCPEISEYREGVVKSINPDNDEMEVELLKHEMKPGKIGKFENLKLGEVPLPEIKTKDVVSWSALIEPKIICQ